MYLVVGEARGWGQAGHWVKGQSVPAAVRGESQPCARARGFARSRRQTTSLLEYFADWATQSWRKRSPSSAA